MTIATGDSVTLEYTGRLDDGTVFDTSRKAVAEEVGLDEARPDHEYTPLTVEVGAGEIIPGLDDGLVGLEEGTTTTVAVPPEKAYGEWNEAEVQEFDAPELRGMVGEGLEEGAYLQAQNGQQGKVTHVDEQTVRVDFNHRLAGKTLEFEIEVLEVD